MRFGLSLILMIAAFAAPATAAPRGPKALRDRIACERLMWTRVEPGPLVSALKMIELGEKILPYKDDIFELKWGAGIKVRRFQLRRPDSRGMELKLVVDVKYQNVETDREKPADWQPTGEAEFLAIPSFTNRQSPKVPLRFKGLTYDHRLMGDKRYREFSAVIATPSRQKYELLFSLIEKNPVEKNAAEKNALEADSQTALISLQPLLL